jgi:hypothetical protein
MAMIMGTTSMGTMICTTHLSLPQPPTISFEKNASLSSVATFQCPRWRKPMVVDPDLQAKTRRSWRGIIVQASSSTVQGDRGTSTDESLDAAVKGNDVCVCVCVCVSSKFLLNVKKLFVLKQKHCTASRVSILLSKEFQ